jgi:TonB-dependent receptor
METFTVAAEVEGNAAEINKQKRADIFMESISADSLGTVPDGNIGEFLRYMPGVQINYVNADANTVSMRGQDADATVFTFDGQIPAASGTPPRSSSGSSDVSSRAFEFSQASINNIESIEVYKAPPPWMAPAAGGVINAVTKNAFSQKGRRLRASFGLTGNSEMLHFGRVPGPGARDTWRIKPNGSLAYSEALLNNTLGISVSYSETNSINPSHNYAMTYSPFTAGTAANPVTDNSRFNVNTFTLVDGPQVKTRRNLGLNADYRLGAHTVLKLGAGYNYYLSQNRSHTFRVKPGTIDPASTTTDATIRNAGVDVFDDYSDDVRQSYSYLAGVEHKIGPWKINYSANYSKSDSRVTDLPAMIQSIQYNLLAADGVTVRMTAAPDVPAPLSLTQTAGPDLYNLASYKNTATGLSLQTSPRFQYDRTWNLKADVIRSFADAAIPFDLRAGAGLYQLHRQKYAGQIVLNFLGPDGRANSGDETLPANLFDDTTYGDKFLYGIRRPPLLDPFKVAEYMKQNPLAIQDIASANIARRFVNTQKAAQDVESAYAATTIKPMTKLTVMTGVRFERTENFLRGPLRQNSLSRGITDATAQQLAIFSQTQKVESNYTDYFPNLQTTYRFTPDVVFRAALSRSLKRPDITDMLPNTTVNDTAAQPSVTVTNGGLSPSYSRNIDLGFELYTRPAGKVELGWFKKTVTNYIINEQSTIGGGADNGFDGQYIGYLLNTQQNGGKGEFQGLEASVRQGLQPYLKPLPQILQGWEVFGSFTHFYKAEAPSRTGALIKPLAPKFYDTNTNVGLSYLTPARAFRIEVRTSILPQAVRTLATTTDLRPVYEKRHQRWDTTLRWQINRAYALEFVAANLTNDSFLDTFQGGRETSRRTFGTSYILTFQANLDDLRLPFFGR